MKILKMLKRLDIAIKLLFLIIVINTCVFFIFPTKNNAIVLEFLIIVDLLLMVANYDIETEVLKLFLKDLENKSINKQKKKCIKS